MSLVELVFKHSEQIKNSRTEASITEHLIEEVFELKDEVYNSDVFGSGPDGVFGEAVDIIICALDLIKVNNPNITEEQIMEYANSKCEKWASLYGDK